MFFFPKYALHFWLTGSQFSTWGLWRGFYSILRVRRTTFWKQVQTAILTHEVAFFLDGHIYKKLNVEEKFEKVV